MDLLMLETSLSVYYQFIIINTFNFQKVYVTLCYEFTFKVSLGNILVISTQRKKICRMKCNIFREHKVHTKSYAVTLTVDEGEEKVITAWSCSARLSHLSYNNLLVQNIICQEFLLKCFCNKHFCTLEFICNTNNTQNTVSTLNNGH